MKNARNRRGSALIFVLGLILAISAISVVLIEYAQIELKPRATSMNQQVLRQEAYAALTASIAVIEEYNAIDKGIFSDLQGWDKPLEDGRVKLPQGSSIEVNVSDESAKISLRSLDRNALAKILEYLGISQRDSETCADCIIDWCDEDTVESISGAEKDSYTDDEPMPPNRPMESFNELRYIQNICDFMFDENGEPTELYKRFTNIITLENTPECNLNCASDDTLGALLAIEDKDYDPNLRRAIRGEIGIVENNIRWVKSNAEILARGASDIPTRNVTYQAKMLKIQIRVKRGIAEYNLDAFYGLPDLMASTNTESSQATRTKADSGAAKNSDKAGLQNAAIKTSNTPAKEIGTFKVLKIFEHGAKM